MGTDYVEHRDGNIYVGPSRVTIDSVVIGWRRGETPEQLHEGFPSVPLAHMYGAIAYYLEHQEEIDAWIREGEELWRRGWEDTRKTHADWFARNRERLEAIGVDPHVDAPAEGAQKHQNAPQGAPEQHP